MIISYESHNLKELKDIWTDHVCSVLGVDDLICEHRSILDIALSKCSSDQLKTLSNSLLVFNGFINALKPPKVSCAATETDNWQVNRFREHLKFSIQFFEEHPKLKIKDQP